MLDIPESIVCANVTGVLSLSICISVPVKLFPAVIYSLLVDGACTLKA